MSLSAVPLGHKFTAVLVAAAVGGGVYTWYRHNAAQSGSAAELSFDMHAARRVDPGFVQAHEPAVAFAQSILTDTRLADLSKQAYLSTSAMMSRVGEFRSRLVLTEPSDVTGQELRVQFRDPDPAKAIETANAVANALTTWAPSPDGPAQLSEPTAAAAPQPAAQQAAAAKAAAAKEPAAASQAAVKTAPAPAPAPVKRPAAMNGNEDSGLAASLGALQAQLASVSRDIEEGSANSRARHGYEGRAYAESEQQRLLKSQVHDAQKKASDLRAQATGKDRDRLGEIQEALGSILGGRSVGVSATQLRHEREELTRAMSVIEEQRQAVEKEGSAGTEAASSSAPESAPAPAAASSNAAAGASSGTGSGPITEKDVSGTGAAGAGAQSPAQASSASQPQPAPAPMAGDADAAMLNPLHVVKLAGSAAAPVWWPAAVAGGLSGLLYLLIAAAASRPVDYGEGESEVSSHYGRFITPDVPVAVVQAPAPPVEPQATSMFERGPNRRASFFYEPSPENEPLPEKSAAPGASHAAVEASTVGAVEAGSGDAPAPVTEATERTIFHEKVVEIDPWADLMEKALSETEIGRKFESPAKSGDAGKMGDNQRPSRPDRWAS